MTASSRISYANDWCIVRKELADISAIVGVGLEEYSFKSYTLRYKCSFYLPKVSIGASIGARLSQAASTAVTQTNSELSRLRAGNSDWRVLRRFPANDLVGGRVYLGTVGATTGVFTGSGTKLLICDNRGIDVAVYEGGEAGIGIGASINIGRAAVGLLLGPYHEIENGRPA